MNKYLTALKKNVCSVCIDSDNNGNCELSEQEICAVERFYPEIVEIIHSVQSSNMQDYISALRENLCTVHCRMDNETEICYLREDANCALDRHFPLIVETILRADKYD